MKTLVVVGHPNLRQSKVNKAWSQVATSLRLPNVIVRNLDEVVRPDGSFDIEAEQALLMDADRLIMQFPLWWYMPPYIMKRWMDTVWAEGFGWGEGGDKMKHLIIDAAVSCGAPEVAFSGTSLIGYLSFLSGSIDFVQAKRGKLFSLYNADVVGKNDPSALAQSCDEYKVFIQRNSENTDLYKSL